MSAEAHALLQQSLRPGPHDPSYGPALDHGHLHHSPLHQQPHPQHHPQHPHGLPSPYHHHAHASSLSSPYAQHDPYGHPHHHPGSSPQGQHHPYAGMQHHVSSPWHDESHAPGPTSYVASQPASHAHYGQHGPGGAHHHPMAGGPTQPFDCPPPQMMHARSLSVSHGGSMPAPAQTPPQMAAAAAAAAAAAQAASLGASTPQSHNAAANTSSGGGEGSTPTASTFAFPRETPFDPTGQQCPPGGRPRVSTTIWEDEGTLCFQVEALGVTVARREDDNMINGTKLLNVAQMSRGKRDGILKNEPDRKVIKVGSMHLKGVWIPFDRALDLANRYSITDALYPLFVQDIKRFLLHPANYARTAAVFAAATQRGGATQPGSSSTSVDGDERPGATALHRALSMPMPLDRSLTTTLTPPSSASTNGDYWGPGGSNARVPLSESQARSHSLPGTPAQTPPAPQYLPSHMQQPYIGSSLANGDGSLLRPGHPGMQGGQPHPGASYFGPRYGQQPDMQRMYSTQHSRNPSMMSYENEDMSIESSSVALTADHASVNGGVPPPGPASHGHPHQLPHQQQQGPPSSSMSGHHARQRSQQIRGGLASPVRSHHATFEHAGGPHEMRLPGIASSNAAGSAFSKQPAGPQTPGGSRSHARTQSRGSTGKVFSTPNLTTQMNRFAGQTPTGSPTRTTPQGRPPGCEGVVGSMPPGTTGGQSSAAANWVQQQQQMAYNTPQQPSQHQLASSQQRPMTSQQHPGGGLPQIYEETPSCRMAYQLHGTREGATQARAQEEGAQQQGESDQQQRAGGQSAPRFIDYGQPSDDAYERDAVPRPHTAHGSLMAGSAPGNMGLGLAMGRLASPRPMQGAESPLSGKMKRGGDARQEQYDHFQHQQQQQHAGPPRYDYGSMQQQERDGGYHQPPQADRLLQSPLNPAGPGSGGKHSDGSSSSQQQALVQQYRAQQQQQMGDYNGTPRGSPTPPPLTSHEGERPSAKRQRSFRD